MSEGGEYSLQVIGRVHSPYRQKFGIPRQPGLVSAALGHIELIPPFDDPQAFRGIDGFSHLWIQFIFHQTREQGWQALIRPPRLGGREKVGVFASRSPYRPNALGLSVVRHHGLQQRDGKRVLRIQGMDLLHGTPVVDIKPYVPYADALPDASGGFADEKPRLACEVKFSSRSQAVLKEMQDVYPHLQELICQILAQDPRPAWYRGEHAQKRFQMQLYELDICWQVQNSAVQVMDIVRVSADRTVCS